MAERRDPFGVRTTLETPGGPVVIYSLPKLAEAAGVDLDRLPFTIRILLENLLRNLDGETVTEDDVLALARWQPKPDGREIGWMPSRVLLQDFTGVPAVVDLAAMRSAVARMGGDPKRINPLVPADLVIDHSVIVDAFGTQYAFFYNVEKEFERNRERYTLLRWAQNAFDNFRVVPPGTGIVHQVNLEYLAKVVHRREEHGEVRAYPDTLVGTDSHTTMVNGMGVLGWGVGGIEAEAVMLGQPYFMQVPEVVGFRLTGHLPEGATATDLVLTVTQMLRKKGVVGKFVEFFGPGLSNLPLADRATIGNMAPEYGATCGFFPVDGETLGYLRLTGRDEEHIALVERYCKEQGLFRTDQTPDPVYSDVLELDLGDVEPSLAGPRRPQDRVPLREAGRAFREALATFGKKPGDTSVPFRTGAEPGREAARVGTAAAAGDGAGAGTGDAGSSGEGGGVAVLTRPKTTTELTHGSVVIAAITSCTNTSNPSVMLAAGLLAKKAVERGLTVKPYVKTSLAPGSRVVTDYLREAGLLPYLEALRFHVVGYGCTTCIGNSGALPEDVAQAITENDLVAAAVLSGNRNFEGRINPLVKANYLASPPLVVAYALAGTVDINLLEDPLGYDPNGRPVYLRDIWPTQEEIQETIRQVVRPELFKKEYARVFEGPEQWRQLPAPTGELYEWDPNSTYIQEPPFFKDMADEPGRPEDIVRARVLALLGDSITTDHISPAGSIPKNSPAGQYLLEHGVQWEEFNTYGSRRGNHEVMMRGTFANIRLRNQLVPGTEGGWTLHIPSGEKTTIYDAAMRYQREGTPLIVIGGKEYGTGSSRDWAAKGTYLLGVKAVIAESFERIHRSNLVGMGVLPLQFVDGQNAATLGLTGTEEYFITGIGEGLTPRKRLQVTARRDDGSEVRFEVLCRLDTPIEVEYYRHGGILQKVLRQIMQAA
ncbi:aconitase [Thermaerobacter marianensis DSM 12885]|uniref:Aconitate hydratase A n=1 Tax=Thermaerobacter marianensis (strain ATCC 700841 / DSM 12885 / JCM 10246 / 7p75a) TaxID=644966 RepID=E6SHK0_THEM7|nr:aconitate hydratase [Thermaerobacter marianensis]ADU51795.1 aconitase [Thermaerobacter marianensis DSM 12885]